MNLCTWKCSAYTISTYTYGFLMGENNHMTSISTPPFFQDKISEKVNKSEEFRPDWLYREIIFTQKWKSILWLGN